LNYDRSTALNCLARLRQQSIPSPFGQMIAVHVVFNVLQNQDNQSPASILELNRYYAIAREQQKNTTHEWLRRRQGYPAGTIIEKLRRVLEPAR